MATSQTSRKARQYGTPPTLEWMFSVSIPEPNSGCWLWELSTTKEGYGQVHVKRSAANSAHRTAYQLAKGPIPNGFHIDHLCRVRCCINPDHLEAVTPEENYRRSSRGDNYRPPMKCRKGHWFSASNPPIVKPGSKAHICRICRDAIVKKWNDIGNAKRARPITEEQRLANLARARAASLQSRLARKAAKLSCDTPPQ